MQKTASQIATTVLEKWAISMKDLDRIARIGKKKLVRPPRGLGKTQAYIRTRLTEPANIFVRGSAAGTDLAGVQKIHENIFRDARRGLGELRNAPADWRELRPLYRTRVLRSADMLKQVEQLRAVQRPLVPLEQRYHNYLAYAHELDELALRRIPQSNPFFLTHVSPDVIFRESNRVATLPLKLRQLGIEEKALRVGQPEGVLFDRIRAKYPQLGMGRYGEKRINRRLRRFLIEEVGKYPTEFV